MRGFLSVSAPEAMIHGYYLAVRVVWKSHTFMKAHGRELFPMTRFDLFISFNMEVMYVNKWAGTLSCAEGYT